MTMDNGPFENVFPIENCDFSLTTLMLADGHQPNNRGLLIPMITPLKTKMTMENQLI